MTWPLVVGLGSHHGDDQAAWLVLDELQQRDFPDTRLLRLRHPADLLDVTDVEQKLVICDACVGGGRVGKVHCFRWPSDKLVYERSSGSHDLSLSQVLELGRQLNCLPKQLDIWALEGEKWTAGTEPSAAVRSAAVDVADAIWKAWYHA